MIDKQNLYLKYFNFNIFYKNVDKIDSFCWVYAIFLLFLN